MDFVARWFFGPFFREKWVKELIDMRKYVQSISLRVREIDEDIIGLQKRLMEEEMSVEQETDMKVLVFRLKDKKRLCEGCLRKAFVRVGVLERRLGLEVVNEAKKVAA